VRPNPKNFQHLKKNLERYHSGAVYRLQKTHGHILKGVKHNAATVIGSAMLASGVAGVHVPQVGLDKNKIVALTEADTKLNEAAKNLESVQNILSTDPQSLTKEQETLLEISLSDYFDISLKTVLDNNRLNSVWGYFGQEQHLRRWPNDKLLDHGQNLEKGIAPALGAFGYFDNAEQEKYYIAAQIHVLHNWNTDWPVLKPWYKFRKVLVYNPKNQRAVVAVFGDAGPATWTGKQFGGSPELMDYLDMYDGSAKSRALVLFVDDSHNNVKLGPIESPYKITTLASLNK